MESYLITGASGYLGKSILKELDLLKFKVFKLGRNSSNDIYCDLSKEIPLINIKKIDVVVHAAGIAHVVPKSQYEKKYFFDVNVGGTQNLLFSLSNLPQLPKSFIFISSVAVYGKFCGLDIGESELLEARDPYGLSKIRAEQIVSDWCKINKVKCTILRLPLIVDKNPPGNLGSLIKAINNGYYFNIGGGGAKKSMVLAKDVAKFIPSIASIGGIYNLTDGEHPSFKDLSEAISRNKVRNLPLIFAKLLGYVGDFIGNKWPINSSKLNKITSSLTFDDLKARKIGWNPQPVLQYLKYHKL